MCNFLSGVVTRERHPRILCADLYHHERTVEALGLTPETYREWEWTAEDHGASLFVRAAPGENAAVLKSAILSAFPRRENALQECINQIGALPDSVGGDLDLRGCTLPDGLKLPEGLSIIR